MIQSPDLEFGHRRVPESVLLVKTHSCITKFKFCKTHRSLLACKNICPSLVSILAKHGLADGPGNETVRLSRRARRTSWRADPSSAPPACAKASSSRRPASPSQAPKHTAPARCRAASFLSYGVEGNAGGYRNINIGGGGKRTEKLKPVRNLQA